jgi:hypothetical protein
MATYPEIQAWVKQSYGFVAQNVLDRARCARPQFDDASGFKALPRRKAARNHCRFETF